MAQPDLQKAQRIIYLTAGFIKGELNFGEQQELSDWKDERFENRLLFEELINDSNRANAVNKMLQADTEARLSRLKLRMEGPKQRKHIKSYWYAAAAAILIVSMSVLFFRLQPKEPQLITINVPFGQLKQLTLPDNSKVWLNAGTTLQYPEQFIGTTRHVMLNNGQAYFEVAHDQAKPFIVAANGADITVLGTAFEIKAFHNEKDTKVTVSNGKVGVLPSYIKTGATMLLPDEQATINILSRQVSVHKIKGADIASWRQNKLVFEKEDFRNVIAALERKYNIKILVLNSGLFAQKITLRLSDQPLTTVLNVLSFSNNFTYKQQNEQLIVVR